MTDQSEIAALPDASQAIRRTLLRLPKNAASFILSALSAASWFMAPVNLLNFLTGLKSAAELWAKLYHWCANLNLPLGAWLDGLGAAFNFIFTPWRALLAPLRVWLSEILPALPHFAADLLLMALISLPALLRLVSNFISAQINAVRLVGDIDKIEALGEPGDPLNAQIQQELLGARRLDVLQDLITQRSEAWRDDAVKALNEIVALAQAGTPIDFNAPDAQAREHAAARAMAASGAGVRIANLNLQRFHIRSSLRLLRFTAILSLIGAGLVSMDYIIG
jgi:hypothetical protein